MRHSVLLTKLTHVFLPHFMRRSSPQGKSLKVDAALALVFTELQCLEALEKEISLLQCVYTLALQEDSHHASGTHVATAVPSLHFVLHLLNASTQARHTFLMVMTPTGPSLQKVRLTAGSKESTVTQDKLDEIVALHGGGSLTHLCQALSGLVQSLQ
jgi:hypothetical protein